MKDQFANGISDVERGLWERAAKDARDAQMAEKIKKGGRASLEEVREKQMFLPIVVNILTQFMKVTETLFVHRHLVWLWPLMVRLVAADSIEIRTVLGQLMAQSMTAVVEKGVEEMLKLK